MGRARSEIRLLAGIAGFALGAVPVIQKKRERGAGRAQNGALGLYALRKACSTRVFLSWVQEGARKFAIGV
jgi:hypothetical protein